LFGAALLLDNFTKVTDFTPGTDKIALGSAIFTAAGSIGPLATAAFFMGSHADDADDRIIVNAVNGNAMYDANGNGAGAAVTFARVTAGLTLTASDFKIV
jgi:Ca2+-binding RTX toxin-like protein